MILAPAQVTLAGVEVTAPGSGTADAQRTDAAGNSTTVSYVVEQYEASVKFEDAPVGLGEDGAVQTDRFTVHVQGATNSVTATIKAGTQSAETTVHLGQNKVDALGFRISLVSVEDGAYTIEVSSVNPPHALSHVSFEFVEPQLDNPGYD